MLAVMYCNRAAATLTALFRRNESSIGVLVASDDPERLENDLHVQPGGPVAQILEIEPHSLAHLLDEVRGLAAAVARGPSVAFRTSKTLVRRIEDEHLRLEEVLTAEAAAQGAASQTADYREGFAAFQSKRDPKFIGA